MRLSKYLQQAGVASRRHADELIFSGQVKINGKVVDTPFTPVLPDDKVSVNGKLIQPEDQKVYFLLNKPRGYLCTSAPGSKRVIDLFSHLPYRLFTVGRLDKETEGLIIVTNDGDFANKVIHPSSNIDKEYVAKVDVPLTDLHLKTIAKGTVVEEVFVKPLSVQKMNSRLVKIVVGEGKKREVRILLADAGLETIELTRTRIGPLKLGRLAVGDFRELNPDELFE